MKPYRTYFVRHHKVYVNKGHLEWLVPLAAYELMTVIVCVN